MRALLTGPTFSLTLTLLVYVLAERVYARTRVALLTPVLLSIAVLCALLPALHLDYAVYAAHTRIVGYLLGPAVVALGVVLYEQFPAIVRLGRGLLLSLLAGSATGIVTAVLTAKLLGASPAVVATLAPKSVTTPIAMAIAEKLGGVPSLAATIVILVGVFGSVAGPPLLRALGVRSRTAFGLAMGAAAHGVGTARAMEHGELEGATAALAICLNGLLTALLAPPLLRLLAPLP
jgi:predicted murein hydrolase (TIGR00659 family)